MPSTLYYQKVAGEPSRTRVILPKALIEYYNLPVKISAPDDVYPSKFSDHVVPVMVWEDGTLQEESIPIVLAIVEMAGDKADLLGNGSLIDRSQILQWMCKFNYDLMNQIVTIMFMKIGRSEFNQETYDRSFAAINSQTNYIEKYLGEHDFLVGNKTTIADLYCCTYFMRGFEHVLDEKWRTAHPNIVKWWNKSTNHEIYNGFFKDLKYLK